MDPAKQQAFQNALLAVLGDLRSNQITFKQALEEVEQVFIFHGWTPPQAPTSQADAAERAEAERFKRGVPGHPDNDMGQ